MSVRYVLAPQAALDLVEIWRYIKNQASLAIADRVESAIREKIVFLAGTPGAGHSRKDLTGIHTIIGYLGYLALPQFLSTRKEKICKNVLTEGSLVCFIQ